MSSKDKEVKTGQRWPERGCHVQEVARRFVWNTVSWQRGEEYEARLHDGFHSTLHPITTFVTLFPKLFTFPSQLCVL